MPDGGAVLLSPAAWDMPSTVDAGAESQPALGIASITTVTRAYARIRLRPITGHRRCGRGSIDVS